MKRDPLDALTIVLEVRNGTDEPASPPNSSEFSYRRNDAAPSLTSPTYLAIPAMVAAHSSVLMSIGFLGVNFGGVMFVAAAGIVHDLQIPGPPVPLPNTATEHV